MRTSSDTQRRRGSQDAYAADLAEIYAEAAARDIGKRNPIVFVPGIMGSKLVDTDTAQSVWGDFNRLYADPTRSGNRRLIALPVQSGKPLNDLVSTTEADGTLGVARPSRLPFVVGAYRHSLQAVGIRSAASA